LIGQVKIDILAAVNHRKCYSSCQYMLHVSVVLTIIRYLPLIHYFKTPNKMHWQSRTVCVVAIHMDNTITGKWEQSYTDFRNLLYTKKFQI